MWQQLCTVGVFALIMWRLYLCNQLFGWRCVLYLFVTGAEQRVVL